MCALFFFVLRLPAAYAQGTAPTFSHTVDQHAYTLLGHDPAQAVSTTIPTVLVPIELSFAAKTTDGRPFVMAAAPDVPRILSSPIFSRFAFSSGNKTQYGDALLRTTFPNQPGWHTLLGKPEVKPLKIDVPLGYGYILTSRKERTSFAVVDVEFLQQAIFKQLPRQEGKLILAVTHNTTYYTDGDATECCSWGTHGVDTDTGNSFVLSSYLRAAPAVVRDRDVQPITQQLAEFINDPLHDPLFHGGHGTPTPGNSVPRWTRLPRVPAGDQGRCGGSGIASMYFLLEPTNTNGKNEIPASPGFVAQAGGKSYHLQNVALLPWYTGSSADLGSTYSFPDASVLTAAAEPCPASGDLWGGTALAPPPPNVAAIPNAGSGNGHKLIGYWEGYGRANAIFPLREVSPQWDVIIVAFAKPAKNAPEGTMEFHTPAGLDPAQFKADIALLKSQGKKVMISLGGGGEHFTLADPKRVPLYVSTVTQIVSEYGTTPSIVNLISALQQLHDHFGPGFMISLVPEGTQIPAGYPSYGGQFGSYLAITYAIRDILSFVDVQDYNTPPLQGLDGEIYQPGSVDYHAAMTELLLHGFPVGGDPKHFFPPMPPDKVAVGFLTPDTTPAIVMQAMDYIITGTAPPGTTYKLRNPAGYPGMIGAMFWTINDDRRQSYNYSNTVGPQLHSFPRAK
jgi:chitinase